MFLSRYYTDLKICIPTIALDEIFSGMCEKSKRKDKKDPVIYKLYWIILDSLLREKFFRIIRVPKGKTLDSSICLYLLTKEKIKDIALLTSDKGAYEIWKSIIESYVDPKRRNVNSYFLKENSGVLPKSISEEFHYGDILGYLLYLEVCFIIFLSLYYAYKSKTKFKVYLESNNFVAKIHEYNWFKDLEKFIKTKF